MGFKGAEKFAGKRTGVQADHAPHSIFVHYHCHKLQLACFQAANSTNGIKHIYTTLTTLWKFFHYSSKRCVSLKEAHVVLEILELKIVKHSDIRGLAHEKCVCTVKKCYIAIVAALEQIYEDSHEPKTIGISKLLMKPTTTLFVIYLLDFVLPLVSKLGKCLQTES